MSEEKFYFTVERFPFEREAFSDALYNQSSYLQVYETSTLLRFSLVRGEQVLIHCSHHLREGRLQNAVFSSFGGIEVVDRGPEHLDEFLNSMVQWCKKNKLDSIELKLPSSIYDRHGTEQFLTKRGFKPKLKEVNQHLVISTSSFRSIIKKNERKKLRQCHEKGFRFSQIDPRQLKLAYDIIADNRLRRNFPITMTFEKLKTMFDAFPDRYLLFGVFEGEALIATAVSIVVTEKVLYNFYHGDKASYRKHSPVVMLLEGIYQYSQDKGLAYLDLGISSSDGVLNEGLFRFKANCGCVETDKVIMSFQL